MDGIAANYIKVLNNPNLLELVAIGEFLSAKSKVCEELPMIIFGCDSENTTILQDLISGAAAITGAHSVRLGNIAKNLFNFSLKFLHADGGVYITCVNDSFILEFFDIDAKIFAELDNFMPSASVSLGRISGYGDIFEKYIRKYLILQK